MEYDKFCENLHNKYGRIFSQIPYIECDGGWFEIIDELSEKLNEVAQQYSEGTISVVQIKEKFGGLRYYVDYADGLPPEDIFDIEQVIRKYEHLSYKTCSHCGKDGSVCARRSNWVSTLCPECAEILK